MVIWNDITHYFIRHQIDFVIFSLMELSILIQYISKKLAKEVQREHIIYLFLSEI